MNYKYNYVPVNLDLNQLAGKLPKESNLDKDKLGYIVSTILHAGFTCNTMTIDGYVPLYSPILKKQMYNYKKAIDFLVKESVISTTDSYWAGSDGYSRGYRIQPKYATTITAKPITNTRFSHSLKRKANTLDKNGAKRLSGCAYLDKWLESPLLTFDASQAKIDLDKYVRDTVTAGEAISLYEIQSLSYAIARCSAQDLIMGRDTTSGRYHTAITGLKSDFRSNFKFNGKPLVQIDIINCQPYLAQVVFKDEFWRNGISSLQYYHTYINSIYSIMLQKPPVTPINTEISFFIEQVNNGVFYESYIDLVKQTSNVKLSRNEAKVAMYQVLFSSNQFKGSRPSYPKYDATLKDIFAKTYPSVNSGFEAVKEDGKEGLAILLQNIESYLIIDVCCKRITIEKPDCPIFTIHDSISTTPEYVDYVKSVITEEFEKFIGTKPPLKTEPWV